MTGDVYDERVEGVEGSIDMDGLLERDSMGYGDEDGHGNEDGYDDNADHDEDGLGRASSPASIDRHYLEDTVGQGGQDGRAPSAASTQAWRVQHSPGDFKYAVGRFLTRVLSKEFDGAQALEMVQRRCTMNYGSSKVGSRRAAKDGAYRHSFHLDFLSIVGRPLRAIVKRSGRPFDNITISLHRWQAAYNAKHAKGLPADMKNKTFRLGESGTREKWYIVMHPKQRWTAAGDEASSKQRKVGKDTAMVRYHAEALAAYIKSLFLDSTLLEQRVEAGWKLGGTEEKTMAFNHWVRFQVLFMERWPTFMQLHGQDAFWRDNQPAFHAYDYGANIEIEVTEQLQALGPEASLRPVEGDDDEDSASDSASDSEGEGSTPPPAESAPTLDLVGTELASEYSDVQATEGAGGEAVEALSVRAAEEVDGTRGSMASNKGEGSSRASDEGLSNYTHDLSHYVDSDLFASSDEEENESLSEESHSPTRETEDGLYSEGLKQLRRELEEKYNLDHVDVISYALAVNVKAGFHGADRQGEGVCLLADRNQVGKQYGSKNGFTFYSLGFHPAYGNFTSTEPPRFLSNGPLAIMKDNMSYQNDGADILEAGYWQAYNNIKSLIRHTSGDLLATRGSATAALSIPAGDAASRAQTKKTQQTLLHRIRGGLTPDNRAASTPFARERQRVEAAMAGEGYDFRMEQVLSVNVRRMLAEHRTFATVLHPIFGLMRFFLREKDEYLGMLRQFPPVAFPGVLAGFARVFELALGEMEARFRADGSEGLGLALSEGVAALDRLGNFCFTGDPTVLPSRVLRPLKTMDSLREGAWPFISPDMLDFREGSGYINLRQWPRNENRRPLLMHVASLAFHYGGQVAANRESQLWFSELGGSVIKGLGTLGLFVEEVFQSLWKEDMRIFISYQIQHRLSQGIRGGQAAFVADQGSITDARGALARWEQCWNPFTLGKFDALQDEVLSIDRQGMAIDGSTVSRRTRHDVARDLYETLKGKGPSTAFASKHSRWSVTLRAAIQHTSLGTVTKEQWIDSIANTLHSAGIEWMPGSHRGKITSRRIIKIIQQEGIVPYASQVIVGQPGSLKRAALQAAADYEAKAARPKRARRRKICFRYSIPFRQVPELILRGFQEQKDKGGRVGEKVLSHYEAALQCLRSCLGDPRCDVLLILVLTICSSSERLDVKEREAEFSLSEKPNSQAMLAACLTTRMLWFMRRDAFPWTKDEGQVLRVPEMIKRMEHKGNLRMLLQMRWIRLIKGNRPTPRMDEVVFAEEEDLLRLRKDLLAAMKEPESFIELVLGTRDPRWVARFSSIIVDT